MSCKHEGSTHFACDCVLEQLKAADALAKAAEDFRVSTSPKNSDLLKKELAAYEKVRGMK